MEGFLMTTFREGMRARTETKVEIADSLSQWAGMLPVGTLGKNRLSGCSLLCFLFASTGPCRPGEESNLATEALLDGPRDAPKASSSASRAEP